MMSLDPAVVSTNGVNLTQFHFFRRQKAAKLFTNPERNRLLQARSVRKKLCNF